MPGRPSRRKHAIQRRSKETEAFILEAAVQVFSELGYAGATTTRIADRAGVSVGTLYQYFADKDEVLFALWEEHSREAHEALRAVLADDSVLEVPLRELVLRLATATVALHCAQPDLHRVLAEEIPKNSPVHSAIAREDEALTDRAVDLFTRHPGIELREPERTVRLAAHLLESLSHWYALEEPDLGMGPPEFAAELTDLMLFCLEKGA